MLERILTLSCTVIGVFLVTVSMPELLYYSPPMDVLAFGIGIVVGSAGIRAILKGTYSATS